MYGKFVGEICKDVFSELKGWMHNVKGVQHIDLGTYHYPKHDIETDIQLYFMITEAFESGDVYVDGAMMFENSHCVMELQIGISHLDYERAFSKLQPLLRDVIRHEIEHITHDKKSPCAKYSKLMRGDTAMRIRIENSDDNYKYYILPKEIDANIHGLYAKAKTMRIPYQEIIDDYLDSLVQYEIINRKQRRIIYNKWKNRIPKIGGIPELR